MTALTAGAIIGWLAEVKVKILLDEASGGALARRTYEEKFGPSEEVEACVYPGLSNEGRIWHCRVGPRWTQSGDQAKTANVLSTLLVVANDSGLVELSAASVGLEGKLLAFPKDHRVWEELRSLML